MRKLTYSNFDSPDQKGSGSNMSAKVIRMFNEVQRISGVELRINSGYRTEAYQQVLKQKGYETSETSPHKKGLAADVGFPADKFSAVLKAGIKAGFKRIGLISHTALHFDIDENSGKRVPAIWTYRNTPSFIKPYIPKLEEIIKKNAMGEVDSLGF